jgi:hypothetical protein
VDPRLDPKFAVGEDVIVKIAEIWRWNREMYPGWMVAPKSVRDRIWANTHNWISAVAQAFDRLHPVQFLFVLDELLWRLETCLAPHLAEVLGPAEATLQRIDLGSRIIICPEDEKSTFDFDWSVVTKAWCRVGIAISSEARFSGKFERATSILRSMDKYILHDDELANPQKYEHCLLLRDQAKFYELRAVLMAWDTSISDSAWSVRKCGLLAGIGYYDEATECLEAALLQTRKHRRRDRIDFGAFSREAWLLWMASALKMQTSVLNGDEAYREPIARLRELGAHDCNVLEEFGQLVDDLKAALRERKSDVSERTDFFGNRSQTFHLGSGLSVEIRRAYEILRLADSSGVPAAIGRVTVLADGLRASAQVLIANEGWYGLLWTLRSTSNGSEEDLQALSQLRIALLQEEQVELGRAFTLAEIIMALDCDAEKYKHHWSNRLPAAIEVFARLVLRNRPDGYGQDFDLARRLLAHERCANNFSTFRPLATLLQSLCRVGSTSLLIDRMPFLFAIPIQPRDRIPEPAQFWPNELQYQISDIALRAPAWNATLGYLFQICRSDDPSMRSAALQRMKVIVQANLLCESETKELADVIWSANACDQFGWPIGEQFYPWAYFYFPEQFEGQRDQAFRRRFLRNVSEFDDFSLRVVGTSLQVADQNNVTLKIDKSDLDRISNAINKWMTRPVKIPKTGLLRLLEPLDGELDVVNALIALVPRMDILPDTALMLWTKLEALESQFPQQILQIYPMLIVAAPQKLPELTKKLREAIVSSDLDSSSGACHALWKWFDLVLKSEEVPIPPEDIVGELGYAIARRREAILEPALQLANWLVRKGPAWARDKIAVDLETGLNFLMEEAKYDGALAACVNLPLIRRRIAELAVSVKSAYFDAPEIFQNWCEAISLDPLTEVRTGLNSIAADD